MSERDRKYEIDLISLKEGEVYEYDYQIGKEFFEARENEDILDSDISVHLTVKRQRDIYFLGFECDGTLSVACDRCLDPVELETSADYDVKVRHGEEYDDSNDDLLIIPERWTRLDVSGLIYDTILLTIPLRCVHPAGECNREMSETLRAHEGTEDVE